MIVKGKPRSGPEQLAAYLLRSDEHAKILELQYGDGDLTNAFIDWDAAGGATRGEKTLYHAQIAWEARYDLDEEQCLEAARILAKNLGMENHPRAVIRHEGDGRPHLHVVFMRTDTETMTMWDDGKNYLKHEKASLEMELKFGHAIVPGKHAKRDRQKQPEFPRSDMSRAEAQLAKRTGRDLKAMQAELAGMKAAADSPQAFKAAVENAGFVLAHGERGYTLVDGNGAAYSLARQLKLKIAEVNEYMLPVPLSTLPTAEQAQALQAVRRQKAVNADLSTLATLDAPTEARNDSEPPIASEKPKKKARNIIPEVKAEVTALRAWSDGAQAFKNALEEKGYTLARGEAGYCLVSQEDVYSLVRYAGTTKVKLEALMAPIPLETLPTVKEVIAAQREAQKESRKTNAVSAEPAPTPQPTPSASQDDLGTRMEISALDMAAQVIAEVQKPAHHKADPELEALEKALAKRHADETEKMRDRHAYELRTKEVELDRETARRLGDFTRIQDEQTERFLQSQKEYQKGIWGIIDAINSRWNPTLAAEKAQARERERQNFYRRMAKERADYEALLQQTKQLEIENLIERQRIQRDDFETRSAEEKERYIKDYHEAQRLRAEIQERQREEELEKEENRREGPPPPELGK